MSDPTLLRGNPSLSTHPAVQHCECGHVKASHRSAGTSWPHPSRFGVCLVKGCGCRGFVEVRRVA